MTRALLPLNYSRSQEVAAFDGSGSPYTFHGNTGNYQLSESTDHLFQDFPLSLKLTDLGGGAGYPSFELDNVVVPSDYAYFTIRYWLPAGVARTSTLVRLYPAGSNGGGANHLSNTMNVTGYNITGTNGALFEQTIKVSEFTESGTMTRQSEAAIFMPGTVSGDKGDMYIESIHFHNGVKPIGMITFDDGAISVYTHALPVLSGAGITATVFVIPELVETNPGGVYMSATQLHEMEDTYGWTVCNHGYESIVYGQPGWQADVEAGRDWMLENGFAKGIDCYAYPTGIMEEGVTEDIMASMGYAVSRTISGNTPSVSLTNVAGLGQPYRLPGRVMASVSVSAADITGQIDLAIEHSDYCILYAHRIDDATENASTWLTSKLQTVADYAAVKKASGQMSFRTMDQFVNGFTNSRSLIARASL